MVIKICTVVPIQMDNVRASPNREEANPDARGHEESVRMVDETARGPTVQQGAASGSRSPNHSSESQPGGARGEAEAQLEAEEGPSAKKANWKPRTANQLVTGTYVITGVDAATGAPTAPREVAQKFSNNCGCLVRDHVPITVKEWKAVPQTEKEALLEQLFNIFVVPEEHKKAVARHAGIVMANALKNWRYQVNKDCVKKGRDPFHKWPKITPEQWTEFREQKTSEDFLAKSRSLTELRSKNKYAHHLGSGGYPRAVQEWERQDAALRSQGKPVPFEDIEEPRAKHWLRGHTTSDPVTGAPIFPNEELQEVSVRLVPSLPTVIYFCCSNIFQCADRCNMYARNSQVQMSHPEASQESVQSERWETPLAKALGTKEKSGRVRGVGVGAAWQEVFPPPAGPTRRRKRGAMDAEVMEQMKMAAEEAGRRAAREEFARLLGAGSLPSAPSPRQAASHVRTAWSSCASASHSVEERGRPIDNVTVSSIE